MTPLARHTWDPNRIGSAESLLDPANGDDGMADEAVAVIEVERQGQVLTPATEQVPGKAGSACRVVDPTRESEPGLGDSVGVRCRPAGAPSQHSEEDVKRCRGQCGALQ